MTNDFDYDFSVHFAISIGSNNQKWTVTVQVRQSGEHAKELESLTRALPDHLG